MTRMNGCTHWRTRSGNKKKAKRTNTSSLLIIHQIYPVEVDGEYTVDTGHIVAFDETLKFSISKAGSSWLHSFMGGEGLVCRFKGKGRIWCQSHDAKGFGKKLRPYLKVKRTN